MKPFSALIDYATTLLIRIASALELDVTVVDTASTPDCDKLRTLVGRRYPHVTRRVAHGGKMDYG